MTRATRAVISIALVLLVLACTKGEPPVSEATLEAQDRSELERIVALDVKVSQAMSAADDAGHGGDAGAALDVVDKRALPAADEALRVADKTAVKTAWGARKKSELVALLRDRRAAIPAYREAASSDDPEKMLASIQVQAALERRAIGAVAAIKEGR